MDQGRSEGWEFKDLFEKTGWGEEEVRRLLQFSAHNWELLAEYAGKQIARALHLAEHVGDGEHSVGEVFRAAVETWIEESEASNAMDDSTPPEELPNYVSSIEEMVEDLREAIT